MVLRGLQIEKCYLTSNKTLKTYYLKMSNIGHKMLERARLSIQHTFMPEQVGEGLETILL